MTASPQHCPPAERSASPGSERWIAYALVISIIALAYVIAFHGEHASWLDASGNPLVAR